MYNLHLFTSIQLGDSASLPLQEGCNCEVDASVVHVWLLTNLKLDFSILILFIYIIDTLYAVYFNTFKYNTCSLVAYKLTNFT